MNKFKAMIADRRMLIVFAMGFSSGLPLLLTGSTLQAWCKEAGMDITRIGMLALVGVPYSLKFLWSPVLDWWVPPFLGRRRGWLMMSQLALAAALAALGLSNPGARPLVMASIALLVSFLSATQDIGIDAYQIEILPAEIYGLGNQIYILGYRVGMIIAGSIALILADRLSWAGTYLVMSGAMAIGVVTTWLAPEPEMVAPPPRSIAQAVWQPLKDFFAGEANAGGRALWILAFFLLYKIGGDMATSLTTPYYLELGFTKTQIGAVAKLFGLWATILGGIIGGTVVITIGVRRALWGFGVLQGFTYLSFAWLGHFVATTGNASVVALATAISLENLAAGLATAAYATFMGMVVNKRFTATQYALLSSLMGATRVFSAAPSGWLVGHFGWNTFFIFCSVASLPGLLILFKLENPETVEIATAPVVNEVA